MSYLSYSKVVEKVTVALYQHCSTV